MSQIKLIHDTVGHTLTVWFDDPQDGGSAARGQEPGAADPSKEKICEETTDEVVLMKDATGRVIGFELLHYRPASGHPGFVVETAPSASLQGRWMEESRGLCIVVEPAAA